MTPNHSFNPCSGGSIALGVCHGKQPGCPVAVSILVLVEVLPWVQVQVIRPHHIPKFQSLFWWKYCPGDADLGHIRMTYHVVSILVLVEVLPWGTFMGAIEKAGERVSILVLVEVLPWERVPPQ